MQARGWLGPILAAMFSAALFFGLRAFETNDHLLFAPQGHFYIVSIIALLSTIIAIMVGVVGARLRNIKVAFLSLAFVSLAEMFLIHGLSTPTVLFHTTHLPGISAQLSVVLASIWLWASSLPSDYPIIHYVAKWKGKIVPAWTVLLGLFGVASLVFTDLVDLMPLNQNPLKGTVTALVFGLNLITAYRYYQSYRYSRFPLQIAIVYSCGWLVVAQVIMMLGVTWMFSWWLYHLLLLFSMLVMLGGLMMQYSSSHSLSLGFKALFANDPFERVTSNLSRSVRAMIAATENKDTYTAGHNLRVTLYALNLGEELKLTPEQMRALAQGSIVHDVGKIDVPDTILNKPGKLTPEERLTIEQHPVRGYEMCRGLGFMKEELEIIRSHHERWDGTGYPDKLAGERIPWLARIVAVVDVYDAVTSSRSYRGPWTHEQAMALILEGRSAHFDPVCVDAWVQLCEREPQVYQQPERLINARLQLHE